MNKYVVIGFVLFLFCVGVVLAIKELRRNRGSHEFAKNANALLERYEQRNRVSVPENIDERGIRELVNQLLAPEKYDFPDEKLRLLGERAVPALVDALKDPRFLQKRTASDPLLAKAPIETVLNLLRPFGTRAAIEPLSVLLKHEDLYFRKEAALALGSIGANECIGPVTLALADENDYVRSYAMIGIGRAIKEKRGARMFLDAMFEAIVPLLEQDDKSLSKAPEILLRLNRDKAATVMLEDRFFHSRNPILIQILRALNGFEVIVPEEKLRRLMQPIEQNLENYPNNAIYGGCLIALARTGHPSAEAAIQAALKSPYKQVAELAAEALAISKGVSRVVERTFNRMDEVGFDNLTHSEKVFASIQMLINEVNNGGFDQYFFNSSGDYVAQALDGLKEIGARDTELMLTKAMKLFGSNGPSCDREKRVNQLDKLSGNAHDEMSALDAQFYNNPDSIETKLYLYVAGKSESFKVGRPRPLGE